MATEPDTALTKSEGTTKAPGRTPLGVWLLVLVLAGLAVYAGYMALHHRQLHADSEMVRKALASDKERLEASVASLKNELKKSKDAHASSEATAKKSRADAEAASARVGELESKIGTLQSKVADAVSSAEESAKKHLNAQSALKAAEEAKAALRSENDTLKNQISEAQKKLDAAVADLTRVQKEIQEATPGPTPPVSPLPEPSYP